MATIMEFQCSASEFPLGRIFDTYTDAIVELERIIPHQTSVIPYFWVHGTGEADVQAALESVSGVHNVKLIDSVENEYLMRVDWDRSQVGIMAALMEAKITILSGVGTVDGWEFEVRSETREEIGEFRSLCQEAGNDIEITAVHSLLPVTGEGFDLTETQREALVLAFELGYFDSPRRVSLQEIAEEIGITQQSLSSRLRRGHRRLVGATLIKPDQASRNPR